jgi:heme/copper-type cytochrome/quinol oxidase subunit 4
MQYTMNDMSVQMGFPGLIMFLIMAILIILPFWIIFSKAGHSKWLSLLMVVPMVNFVMLYFLAFSTWPNQKDSS